MSLKHALQRLLLITLSVFSMNALAQYPERPIQLVVPFPPGGSTDVVARVVATKAQQLLGQPIIIQNIGGAGSIVGTENVAKAAPDGYTLLVTQTAFAVNATMKKKLSYDTLKDFVPVAWLADHPGVLVAAPAKPYNTFKEFVDYVKARPGQLSYSSAGPGTWPHLTMAALNNEVGLKMEHIAYRGTGPAKMDLLAGRVDAKIEAYATTKADVAEGKLKILAATSSQRMPELPNVPTIAELGYPNFESSYWIAIAGRAGTPAAIIARLEQAFVAAVKDPEVARQINGMSIYPRGLPGKELDTHTRAEIARWGKVVEATGIQE